MPEPGASSLADRELQTTFASLRDQFPGIGGLNVTVIRGQGPGFAEVFPKEEGMNPLPGKDVIELRAKDLSEAEKRAVLLGESLHFLPLRNPEFFKLKQDFRRSLTPPQVGLMKEMHDEAAARGDQRSFGDFMDQVAVDAFIRDFVFQEIGTIPGGMPFVEGLGPIKGAFFPENMESLNAIIRFLRGNDGTR